MPHGTTHCPVESRTLAESSRLWDLEAGHELRTLTGHSDRVWGVAVTPDGRCAISASNDIKLWDLETGRELLTLSGHSFSVECVAVSPEGRRAVSASEDKTLKVWDLRTGACVTTFTCDAEVRCCAFAGARTIIGGDQAGRIHFLTLELGDGK